MVTTDFFRTIAGFAAGRETVVVRGCVLDIWRVVDLERHVDRAALLGGVDPPEPPYWAHLWSGATLLADAVPDTPGRVLELGCGLGLPGLVAARRGGTVTLVDRIPAATAFVAASIAANPGLRAHAVVADMTALPFRARFDLVLAAEVLYDRAAFPAIAATLAGTIALDGRAVLTDAARIDTRAFYDALERAGLVWTVQESRVQEEGFPITIRLVDVRHRSAAGGGGTCPPGKR